MTEIKNAVQAAGTRAQYDDAAKRLLGQKIILAHILVKTVPEFRGMRPKDVVSLIEGTPMIGSVPVEPGLTNVAMEKDGKRVVGFNTEDAQINEGVIRFDIVFYVRMRDGLSQMIINLEAQRKEPLHYAILNRAGFYVSRLISSQKGRDFEKADYDAICPVYSIWILMNMEENFLTHMHLTKDQLLGSVELPGKDMFNIILIGLSGEIEEHRGEQELHRFLGVLLSPVLDAKKKLGIMETEFEIPAEDGIRRDLDEMCNLSENIWEEALQEGEARGEARGKAEGEAGIIRQMSRKGLTPKKIAEMLDREEDEIIAILAEKEISLV